VKTLFAILCVILLAGCGSYGYPVKEAGDRVYYAASPPEYIYVNDYRSFSYFSPYFYPHYFSLWYSPLIDYSYVWQASPRYWSSWNAFGHFAWPMPPHYVQGLGRDYPVPGRTGASDLTAQNPLGALYGNRSPSLGHRRSLSRATPEVGMGRLQLQQAGRVPGAFEPYRNAGSPGIRVRSLSPGFDRSPGPRSPRSNRLPVRISLPGEKAP
jgi:hypothetical protein